MRFLVRGPLYGFVFVVEFPNNDRNKKLLVTKGIATRSKDATGSSWPYY